MPKPPKGCEEKGWVKWFKIHRLLNIFWVGSFAKKKYLKLKKVLKQLEIVEHTRCKIFYASCLEYFKRRSNKIANVQFFISWLPTY